MPKSSGKSTTIKTLELIMLSKDTTFAEKLEACRIWVSLNPSPQPPKPKGKPKKASSSLLG